MTINELKQLPTDKIKKLVSKGAFSAEQLVIVKKLLAERQKGTSDPVSVKSSHHPAVSHSGNTTYVDCCCGGAEPEEK